MFESVCDIDTNTKLQLYNFIAAWFSDSTVSDCVRFLVFHSAVVTMVTSEFWWDPFILLRHMLIKTARTPDNVNKAVLIKKNAPGNVLIVAWYVAV